MSLSANALSLKQSELFDLPDALLAQATIRRSCRAKTRSTSRISQLMLFIFEDDAEFNLNEVANWSDDVFDRFHETLLKRQLACLNDGRASLDSKIEAASWTLVEPFSEEAFSFFAACVFSGYNPMTLRGQIKYLVKHLELANHLPTDWLIQDEEEPDQTCSLMRKYFNLNLTGGK